MKHKLECKIFYTCAQKVDSSAAVESKTANTVHNYCWAAAADTFLLVESAYDEYTAKICDSWTNEW